MLLFVDDTRNAKGLNRPPHGYDKVRSLTLAVGEEEAEAEAEKEEEEEEEE